MAKSMFDQETRDEVAGRIGKLDGAAHGRWGKMDAPAMLAHLAASMRMATGELATRSKRLPIRFFPLNVLFVYFLPFPKGAPTAPELLAGPRQDIEPGKRELVTLIDAFRGRRGQAWPLHPAFGRLSERAWGVLTYRHVDHHLRQFGV